MHVQAAERALADAGLTFDDVDGYATVGYHPMYCVGMSEYLGIHPHWLDETNIGGASFEVHVEHAARAVEAGACDVVLITYGSVQLSAMGRRIGGRGGTLSGPQAWDAIWGNTLVGAYALAATRHTAQYGTKAEQLAEIAVTFRRHAGFNPSAQYRVPITIDDVLESRMVADPLHMLDCCVVSDGGGACRDHRGTARDLPGQPVYVLGGAHSLTRVERLAVGEISRWRGGPLGSASRWRGRDPRRRRRAASSTTRSRSRGVDHARRPRLLCEKERWDFVEERRLAFDGPLPTNTDGGGLSACHPACGDVPDRGGGSPAAWQGPATQVPGAKVALAHGTGGCSLPAPDPVLLGTEAP